MKAILFGIKLHETIIKNIVLFLKILEKEILKCYNFNQVYTKINWRYYYEKIKYK